MMIRFWRTRDRSPEARKPYTKKPRHPEAKKHRSQEAKKPRSQEAPKPGSLEAKKPGSREAMIMIMFAMILMICVMLALILMIWPVWSTKLAFRGTPKMVLAPKRLYNNQIVDKASNDSGSIQLASSGTQKKELAPEWLN